MASKADILAALRADIAALEARPPEVTEDEARASSGDSIESVELFGDGDPFAAGAKSSRRNDDGVASSRKRGDREAEEGKTPDEAYQKILRWVAVRERSTSYLRERLLKDDFPAESVEEALSRAERVRAVDDRRYADALVRMKLAAGRGLRDAEREIEALGIDPETLDSWAEHAQKGAGYEVDRALAGLRRRPPRAKRAREAAYRRLVSQGFSSDVAATAARRWSEEQERTTLVGDDLEHRS